MRILNYHIICLVTIWIYCPDTSTAQETVFSGLGSNLKRANWYYKNESYQSALQLYLEIEEKGKGGDEIYLNLARTCYQLNLTGQVVKWYEKYLSSNDSLGPSDTYLLAESLISQGYYQQAITWLKKCQSHDPDNPDIIKKIWRLQNIHHLYADSSYFEVHPVDLNTEFAEFGPALVEQSLVFVSNRKEKGGISKIDQVTGLPFQSLYSADLVYDSISGRPILGKPVLFLKEKSNGLHLGTITIAQDRLIFTRALVDRNSGKSVLQLFLVDKNGHSWKEETAFQHNSTEYSLSHPSLSSDGNILYFVSDMPGGLGGNDLYESHWTGREWATPVNLGELINTRGDETAPFIHRDKTLYFASNGHGGFGGLDIFRIFIDGDYPAEVENLGFPVNTSKDDFGFILNMDGTRGFMASNRRSGGFNDDLYEVVVDLQSYPLIISGLVRYSDPDWAEPGRQDILPNANLWLVDNLRNASVYQTTSDDQGRFSLEIPYSSRYRLNVSHKQIGELTVSLEIPKNRKLYTDHEIVVVKEKFKEDLEGQTLDTVEKRKKEKR